MKKIILSSCLAFTMIAAVAQAPTGYYNHAAGKTCAELKTALKNIIDDEINSFTGDTYKSVTKDYKDLPAQYVLTDIKLRELNAGQPGYSQYVIWDIYSDKPGPNNDPYNFTPGTNACGSYGKEGDCYNREHTFPASWFNDQSPMYSDYIHILPTDGSVNGIRSNFRYGKVGTATKTSLNGSKLGPSSVAGISGTVFEPIDEYKGDVARIYFYMVTRYEDKLATFKGYNTDGALTLTGNKFPAIEKEYLALMYQWHLADPVSDKERTRNNGAFSFQNNRNPFVDNPEYVNLIWGAGCASLPVDFVQLSGSLHNNVISLTWDVKNEQQLKSYVVERSFNGETFHAIGEVAAKGLNQYNYNDDIKQLDGRRIYYRIKKVDIDGAIGYSAIFSVHVPLTKSGLSVYPNPSNGQFTLALETAAKNAKLIVSDLKGAIIHTQVIPANQTQVQLNLNKLASGTYLVKVFKDGESIQTKIQVIN